MNSHTPYMHMLGWPGTRPEGLRELKRELHELKEHSSRLTAVPDWGSSRVCEQTLDLGGVFGAHDARLKELPAELGKLLFLETLALRNLAGLEKLPDTLCSLTALACPQPHAHTRLPTPSVAHAHAARVWGVIIGKARGGACDHGRELFRSMSGLTLGGPSTLLPRAHACPHPHEHTRLPTHAKRRA